MTENYSCSFSRRQILRLSASGATAFLARKAFPVSLPAQETQADSVPAAVPGSGNLYARLVKTWCDGLLDHQINGLKDPAVAGAFLCSACGLIHGRCSDAIYPLLHVAQTTGDSRYIDAAVRVYDWSERQVSHSDGSWVNDISLQDWQGITVFRSVALAEALRHYGFLLDDKTRRRWTDRLARALKFLDGFITIDTGDINYPMSSTYCFALCSQILDEPHYLERGRNLAHTCLNYLSKNYLIYGEGHPIRSLSAKGFRPVDIGYNVEESLPGLVLYGTLTNDQEVLDVVMKALQAQMEFMIPDGGWDNSFGCRNYKWTWWGSRTSDGCHPAYVLMAKHDPRFREVAQRNVEMMAACTRNGLLYGGPDYYVHGDLPCIHHSFTHAKALTTVLDNDSHPEPASRVALPRDEAYGLRSFPEVGTHLAAVGPWRATVTEYDWKEPGEEFGHVTGGSLSLLFERTLGPILTASMTEYELIEPPNQQGFRDSPHMPLTPRVECVLQGRTYTSFADFKAILKATDLHGEVAFDARGRLLSASRVPLPGAGATYHMTYRIAETAVEITASASGAESSARLQFVLPVVSRSDEAVDHSQPGSIRITKPKGTLTVETDAPQGFEALPAERTFNLVPGLECLPIIVPMRPDVVIHIRLQSAARE
jgi:hypothetical protein